MFLVLNLLSKNFLKGTINFSKVGHFGIETFTIKAQPEYPRLIIQLPFAHLDCEFFQWLIFASEASANRDPPKDDYCSEKVVVLRMS